MKKLILASAVLLAMAACSSDDDGSDLECYTNFTDDTAKLFFSYKGYSLDEIATHYFDDGEYELVYFSNGVFSYSGVVAWMPLPQPYKPQESED